MDTLTQYLQCRNRTEKICAPLAIEDYVVQPIVDVSPPKWHLGHTTWFFEHFVLVPHLPAYKLFNDQFGYVFNSYYESVGKRVIRTDRGNLSRPSVELVYEYRQYVDEAMKNLLGNEDISNVIDLVMLGVQHEQQHQELLLTDIKYILGNNPLQPPYGTFEEHFNNPATVKWQSFDEGIYEIGFDGEGFCFDNELGQHKVYLPPFELCNSLVINQEFINFIEDGGYDNSLLWHSEGWDWVQQLAAKNPLYWFQQDDQWYHYTLAGVKPLQSNQILTHISYYEAYAYANWKGMRLPTEFEWEVAHKQIDWGKRWEWTESAYLPYPNYQRAPGAIGEYNGKFMVNQKVLRGASIATAQGHSRPTYRNFFHPNLRWQYTGIRLAR